MKVPPFFKDLKVISRTEIQGKITEVITRRSYGTVHWKPVGKGWHVDYIQLLDGTIIDGGQYEG